MKTIFALFAPLVLILSAGAHAATAGNPTTDICQTLPYSSDKLSCLQIVGNHFFEDDIVAICGSFPYASDKLSCLQQTADTQYDPNQLAVCKTMAYSSDILSCLQQIAQPYVANPYPNADYVRARLSAAMDAINAFNLGDARSILQELMAYFSGH